MKLKVRFEHEDDGRWLAEIRDLHGVMAYGATPEEARTRVQALALRVLADQLERGEQDAVLYDISFDTPDARTAPETA